MTIRDRQFDWVPRPFRSFCEARDIGTEGQRDRGTNRCNVIRHSSLVTRHSAFTVVELLIVIAVIILLVSLLIVALNAATRTAQRTNTAALMTSISTGLARFKDDLGYYPPVLGPSDACPVTYSVATNTFRDLRVVPEANPVTGSFDLENLQDWYSLTSLAEYLLGYANQSEPNGSGSAGGDGADGLGIRNAGPDGVWGATAASGCWISRKPTTKGKVYPPYLEIDDDHLLAAISSGNSNDTVKLSFPGEGAYNTLAPKVICDYWGNPIRYYRQVHRPGAPGTPWRDPSGVAQAPNLGDIFVLRPWDFKPGEDVSGKPDGNPTVPPGDPSTTYSLKTAQFALFSSGADRRSTKDVRRDDCTGHPPFDQKFNADNLVVEGGP